MKEYVYMILCVSLICGVFKLLFTSAKISAFIIFALRIVVLCVLLTPFLKFTGVELSASNFFVINEEREHSIVSEDPDTVWKFWMAKTSAQNLSEKMENDIQNSFGVCAQVDVPFEESGGEMVFKKIMITADCDEDTCKKIEDFVSLRYSLKSECKTGEVYD